MALTFDTTIGGASATSYATLVQANDYHNANLNRAVWDEAGESTKKLALVMATRILDERYKWFGSSVTATQKLAHPRNGAVDRNGNAILNNVLAVSLIDGTAELAFWLLKSDRWKEPDSLGVAKIEIGKFKVEFDKTEVGLDRQAIIPQVVKEILQHLGVVIGSTSVKLMRV